LMPHSGLWSKQMSKIKKTIGRFLKFVFGYSYPSRQLREDFAFSQHIWSPSLVSI